MVIKSPDWIKVAVFDHTIRAGARCLLCGARSLDAKRGAARDCGGVTVWRAVLQTACRTRVERLSAAMVAEVLGADASAVA
ncbi:hypothetical protein BH160DRAFT_0349 [Burkholderia sp. H160]|nr:hypothetical protein BH160DRAFT_0349 [Burkholderia sp. H160]